MHSLIVARGGLSVRVAGTARPVTEVKPALGDMVATAAHDPSTVMKARKVNLCALKESLTSYIDKELRILAIADCRDATPTPAFQRVV